MINNTPSSQAAQFAPPANDRTNVIDLRSVRRQRMWQAERARQTVFDEGTALQVATLSRLPHEEIRNVLREFMSLAAAGRIDGTPNSAYHAINAALEISVRRHVREVELKDARKRRKKRR